MSNEKDPGCLGYIRDEILPSSVEFAVNHYKDVNNHKQPVFHGKSECVFSTFNSSLP